MSDSDLHKHAPRVSFYLRTAVDGGYKYQQSDIRTAGWSSNAYTLVHPPLVGDLVWLNDLGNARVIERSWTFASYGSGVWPYGENYPNYGEMLTLICEPADGPFRDEAEEDDE